MKIVYVSVIALFSLSLVVFSKGDAVRADSPVSKKRAAELTCPAWYYAPAEEDHASFSVTDSTYEGCLDKLEEAVEDYIIEYQDDCGLAAGGGEFGTVIEGADYAAVQDGDTWTCAGHRDILCCVKTAEPWPDPFF